MGALRFLHTSGSSHNVVLLYILLNTVEKDNEKIRTFYGNVQHAACPIVVLVGRVIEDLRTTDRKKILARLMTLIDAHGNP